MDTRPYFALNRFYKERYGKRVYKIAINAGFTCPNRDGTKDTRGCSFCSNDGSGDFSITPDCLNSEINRLDTKAKADAYIIYLQAYTNTYAPVEELRRIYFNLIFDEQGQVRKRIVGIAIATRPDCIDDAIINLLEEINQYLDVYIELGLQTIHERSATDFRRCYPLEVYDAMVEKLIARNLFVIVHTILGLPNENKRDMLDTVRYVSQKTYKGKHIHGIKLQLLHIIDGTDMAILYKRKPFHILSLEEYIDLIIDCINLIPADIVIHRLTGDGDSQSLIAPTWSTNKRKVINRLHRRMKERSAKQGSSKPN